MHRTKKQLLAEISSGDVSVEAIHRTTLYRVAPAGEKDPDAGVWIRLGPDSAFVVEDYDDVRARIDGRDFGLTQAETNAIVRLIASTMRSRGRFKA